MNERMRLVTFKIDRGLLEELNRYVRLTGLSRSEVIRAAIRKYLAEKFAELEAPPEPVRRKVIVLW